jgi:outer membrane receptor protein involved in Fe transport
LALYTLLATAGAQRSEAATPAVEDLLQLPFEDLLQVEIRSAGKREEQIRDIAASVTIVTRDEIARYGWQTLEDLLRHVPGFFLIDNTEDRFIGTRGAVGGGVQFLVNGIAQHPSRQKTLTVPEIARLNVPVEAIDRIEIIRGPMSVIYGNNAFQGVVNIVTNDIGVNASRASLSLGTRGTGALFARVGQASSEAAWVLNAGARKDDGLTGSYADMMSPAQLAGRDPAMHPDMDGDTQQQEASLEFAGRWRDLSTDLRWTRRDYGIYAFTPAFDDGTRIRLDTWHASLGWAHRFSDRLGLRVTGTHSQEHYDAYQVDFLFPELDGNQGQSSRRWELEADLHWRPRRRIDALFGYRRLQIDGLRNQVAFRPVIDLTDRLNGYDTQDLFAETSWQFDPRLRLVAGARLSLLPAAYRSRRVDRETGIVTNRTLRADDEHQFNGRLALLWSPSADQVVKLIWATASQDSGDRAFAELEQIQTLELNATLTRPRWMLSGSLFQNRTSNIARTIQVFDPETGDYASVDDNSGRWLTRGLELIADARPLPELNLSASLTWQRTEDQRNDIDPGYSPAVIAKLKTDYRHGAFTYAAYARYVDAMEADWDFVAGPVQGVVQRIGEQVRGYWNIGLNLRWNPGGAPNAPGPYAALNLSNLLDSDNRDPANELTNLDRGLIGAGRTLTATVGYGF